MAQPSNDPAQALVRSADAALVLLDPEGRVRLISPAAERLLGWSEGQAPVPGPVQAAVLDARAEADARGRAEVLVPLGPGASLRTVVTPARDAAGAGAAGHAVVFLQPAPLTLAQDREAGRTPEEVRSFLEQAQVVGRIGAWVSPMGDDDQLWWSDEAYRIFGVAPGTPITVATFFSLVHPDDRAAIQAAVTEAVAERRAYAIDHRIVRPDGPVRWLHERADLVFAPDGRPLRLVGVVQDITERRAREQLEAQLAAAQRLESIGRLAGGVAHDFNNLLTAITGYAELMLGELGERHPLREPASEIRRASARAAELTRQLLAFGRRQVLQPQVVCVNDVVRGVERMLARVLGEDVRLVTRLAPGLGRVLADPGQLEQVLVSLAVNARDAMPRGGQLTIETRDGARDRGEGRGPEGAGDRGDDASRATPHVVLDVTDTGTGMDAETAARCFEPFFTTKPAGKGTGLGLSTVWGIVEQSRGWVTVRSALGRGTTIGVHLPRVEREAAPPPAPAPDPALAPSPRATLLLVEDDDLVLGLARLALRDAGYTVLDAADGPSGLAALQRLGRPIDLLLTDVVLPGMSGPELAAEVARRQPGVRVLFMSGYSDEAVARHGILVEGAGFLGKPFTPKSLVGRVRDALSDRLLDGPPRRP